MKRIVVWPVVTAMLVLQTTSQIPTASASNIDFGSPIAVKAFEEIQKRMSSLKTMKDPNINFVIAPGTTPKFLSIANKTVKFAANYYSDFLPINRPITAWVFDDRRSTSWMKEALAATGVHPSGYESAFSKQVSATPDASRDGSLEILLFATHYPDRLGGGDQYEISHEFTHLNQTHAMPRGKGGLLCWQREGMAEYGALAISGRYSALRYQQEILHGTHFAMNLKTSYGTDWTKFFQIDETKSVGDCSLDDYALGALAFQYLEGTYGHSKTMEFIKYLGQNGNLECPEFMKDGSPCPAWKDALKMTFGISPNDLYPEIGKFFDAQFAWAKNLKEMPYAELLKKDSKAFSYPEFPSPRSKPAAGQVCTKVGTKIKIADTEFMCTKFKIAKFYSNIKEVPPWFAGGSKPTSSSNTSQGEQLSDPNFDAEAPDNVIARGRWCPNEGNVAQSWKQETVKCVKNSKGSMVWSAT